MSEQTGPVLHHAEELGQSRPYEKNEAVGLFVAATLTGLWAGLTVLVIGVGYRLVTEYGFWTAFFALSVPAGILAGGGVVMVKGLHEQIDGLRSWREAITYAPPQPQPVSLPHPPIAVYPPGKREPYLLTEPQMPSREPLRLTPGTIAEILQLAIERNKGTWSRRTLTRLTLATGEKLSRGIYETLTPWLARSGVLAREPQGGWRILAEDLEELREIFPNLPIPETGRAGGEPGDRSREEFSEAQPISREVGTLAERRAAEWLECDCDARLYLERRRNHD